MSVIFFASVILKGIGAGLEVIFQVLITRKIGVDGYGNFSTWINFADLIFWVFFSALTKCNTYYLSVKNTSIGKFKRKYYFRYVIPSLAVFCAAVLIIGKPWYCCVFLITGLEMFRKSLEFAQAGDNIGALLRGIDRDQIERGQVLAVPGSVHPHTTFDGHVYVLKKEEGGRHTPFFNNYRPQFYFRTTDVTGIITLPEGTEMCMPGDNVDMHVELITPVAMEEGMRFAIREGGHTVGSGVVSKIEK